MYPRGPALSCSFIYLGLQEHATGPLSTQKAWALLQAMGSFTACFHRVVLSETSWQPRTQ